MYEPIQHLKHYNSVTSRSPPNILRMLGKFQTFLFLFFLNENKLNELFNKLFWGTVHNLPCPTKKEN